MLKRYFYLRRWFYIQLLLIFISVITSFGFTSSVKASISLLFFRAVPGTGLVTLQWATATELNNAGFFILRSNSMNGSYSRINQQMIPAEGDGIIGATYEYIDTNVINGTTYWYRLEDIDSNQVSTFRGPISAIPGGPQQTDSNTPTSSPPLTITPLTPTQQNPELSNTPSLGSPPSPVPVTTNDLFPTVDNSGNEGSSELSQMSTATLIPLPEIAIEFPTPGPKTKKIGASSASPIIDTSNTEENPQNNWSMRYLWLIGIVVIIWGTLGIWLFFVFKKIS